VIYLWHIINLSGHTFWFSKTKTSVITVSCIIQCIHFYHRRLHTRSTYTCDIYFDVMGMLDQHVTFHWLNFLSKWNNQLLLIIRCISCHEKKKREKKSSLPYHQTVIETKNKSKKKVHKNKAKHIIIYAKT
jgi:hypothetical protein